MNEVLKDAYEQYSALGFILRKAEKDQKFSRVTGALIDAKQHQFSESATGYTAVIPPNIIIVDNDKYQDNNASFEALCVDLGYTPEPFAYTPSGGEHYAFNNIHLEKVIGKTKDRYPALDIYAGYQSVIPIVGTRAINKEGSVAEYTWADMFDVLVVNDWDDGFIKLFNMRDRGVESGKTYEDDDDDLMIAMKADPNRKEDGIYIDNDEVDELLAQLPIDLEYDDWIEVGMALYDRYHGSEEGKEKFIAFSKRSPKYDESLPRFVDAGKKWAEIKPNKITYKRLANMVSEFNNTYAKDIEEASSVEEINSVVEKIVHTKRVNTRSKTDADIREELATKINVKLKELKKSDPKVEVKQARTILKELFYEPTLEELEAENAGKDEMEVYLQDKEFAVRIGNKVREKQSAASIVRYAHASKLSSKLAENKIAIAKPISGIKVESDYLIDGAMGFELIESGMQHEYPFLHIKSNPLYAINDYIDDDEIINDFCNNIWKGKAEDVIRLIGLTIRFKETKLNKIMLVAPSNTGKTTFCEHIDFQTVHMKRLLQALNADKGIGAQILDGLKASGLLLIDETNEALPQDIKNIDNYIYLDQFGSGGTQKIKLHYTIMTSTHKTATRTTSDEMYNRLLQVELLESDIDYPLTGSPIFQRDSQRYSVVLKSYFMWLFKDAITNPDYTKDDLVHIQSKYRLELNSDIDDMLYDVAERVIDNIKSQAGAYGDVVLYHDSYYLKRKKDLVGMVEDMLGENSQLDVGKYAEKLIKHFIPSDDERKSIRVDGLPAKYYQVNLRPYNATEEQSIISQFDDLDAEVF